LNKIDLILSRHYPGTFEGEIVGLGEGAGWVCVVARKYQGGRRELTQTKATTGTNRLLNDPAAMCEK